MNKKTQLQRKVEDVQPLYSQITQHLNLMVYRNKILYLQELTKYSHTAAPRITSAPELAKLGNARKYFLRSILPEVPLSAPGTSRVHQNESDTRFCRKLQRWGVNLLMPHTLCCSQPAAVCLKARVLKMDAAETCRVLGVPLLGDGSDFVSAGPGAPDAPAAKAALYLGTRAPADGAGVGCAGCNLFFHFNCSAVDLGEKVAPVFRAAHNGRETKGTDGGLCVNRA